MFLAAKGKRQVVAFVLMGIVAPLEDIQAQSTPPTVQWHIMAGGSGLDHFQSLLQPVGDDIIVVGRSNSADGDGTGNHGLEDAWAFKLDLNGSMLWSRMYGGSSGDGFNDVTRCADGHALLGTTRSVDGDAQGQGHGLADVWVVRLNEDGDINWQRKLGGPLNDEGTSIRATGDGGLLLTASIGSNISGGDIANDIGIGGYWLVKLDNVGAIQWQNRFGGSTMDIPYAMELTNDGGCVIAGYTWSDDGDVTGYHPGVNGDGWVVKTDSVGNLQWQRTLGGSAEDLLTAVVLSDDGGYFVSGWTKSNDGDVNGNHGGGDAWVVKLDNGGEMVWQRAMGGSGSEQFNTLISTSGGGVIAAGTSNSLDGDVTGNVGGFDGWIVMLDSVGNMLWGLSLGGSGNDVFQSIASDGVGGWLLGGRSDSNNGDSTGNHGGQDGWVVRLKPDPSGISEGPPAFPLAVFPNPGRDLVRLQYAVHTSGTAQLEVFNGAGQLVLAPMRRTVHPGPQSWEFDASPLAPGTYQLRLSTADGVVCQRLVKLP